MMTLKNLFVCSAALAGLCAFAQDATPEQKAGWENFKDPAGMLHANATIGSFKLIKGRGRTEINFTGTIMIHGYVPRIAGTPLGITGSVTKEYEDPKRQRVMYHGTGKLVLDGSWSSVQMFGRNINLWFYGAGVFRCRGEFDKNLFVGDYWREDPTHKLPWGTNSTIDVPVPMPKLNVTDPNKVTPKKRGG